MRVLLIVLVLCCSKLWANNRDSLAFDITQIHNYLPWLSNEEADSFMENIMEYYDHPIPLNSMGFNQLKNIPFLTQNQAIYIIAYRKKYGPIRSVNELTVVPGFNYELASWLANFINFNTNITVHKFELVHYTRFGGMLEKRAGYFEDYENGYLGNRWRQLHRTELKKENDKYKIDAGFLTSKDAGEQYLINGSLPYQNSYLQIESKGEHKYKILIGDYKLAFGRGLLLNHSFPIPLSFLGNYGGIQQNLRVSRSVDEFRKFTGVATQVGYKNFNFINAISSKSIAGVWEDNAFNYYTTGYYRTTNELQKQQAAFQQSHVHIVQYNQTNWGLETATFREMLDGKQNYLAQSFYGFIKLNDKFVLDGEWVVNQEKNTAKQLSLLFLPESNTKIKLIYNYFDAAYQSPYSSSFAALGGVKNEEALVGIISGTYWGWKYNMINLISVFPKSWENWGKENYKVQQIMELNRYTPIGKLYLRYRNGNMDKQQDGEYGKVSVQEKNHQFRVHQIFNFDKFSLVSRSELNAYKVANYEYSFLQYVEFLVKKKNILCNLRLAYFDIQSHDSRIYVYIPTVTNAMGMRFYNNSGYSLAFLLKYTYKNWRWENSVHFQNYPQLEQQGTGRDKLNVSYQTHFQTQLIYKFKKREKDYLE